MRTFIFIKNLYLIYMFFFWWCPGFEPRTLHILCIVLFNLAKLTGTFTCVLKTLHIFFVLTCLILLFIPLNDEI